MTALVLYRSEYGHTERYATWLAEAVSTTPRNLTEKRPTPLAGADVAVYCTPVYANNLLGMKQFAALAKQAPEVPLAVVTVSGSGLSDEATRTEVLGNAKKAVSAEVFDRIEWFHLRGGMKYGELKFSHRMMMRVAKIIVQRQAKKGDEAAKNYLSGFGTDFDLTDRESLAPVIAHVQALEAGSA